MDTNTSLTISDYFTIIGVPQVQSQFEMCVLISQTQFKWSDSSDLEKEKKYPFVFALVWFVDKDR